MKKLLTLLVICTLFCSGVYITAAAQTVPDLSPYITEADNYYVNSNHFIVYGNYQNLSKSQINQATQSGKTLVIYFTKPNVENTNNLPYYENQFTAIYKQNGVTKEIAYSTAYKSFNALKEEYINYYNEKTAVPVVTTRSTSPDQELFTLIHTRTDRLTSPPYGYVDVYFEAKRYNVNTDTSLYIVEFETSTTCGRMANKNGDTSYDIDMYQDYTSIHLLALQAEDNNDEYYVGTPRRGGTPVFKDYWPLNAPATATITSSYSAGLTLGYSFTNGFSTSNGFSVQEGVQIGTNIQYSYTKSYTNTEPALSAQLSTTNAQEAQWTYTLLTEKREETVHAKNYYMFEMNNRNHSMSPGQFNFKYVIDVHIEEHRHLWDWTLGWTPHQFQLTKTAQIGY